MNKKIISMIGMVLILLIVGCTTTQNKVTTIQEQVEIGAAFPLTGGLALYGDMAEKSAQLAAEDYNIKLNVQDHECNSKTAVSVFKQLQAKGVKIFTSAACSGTVLSVAPQLEGGKGLWLGTLVSTPKITGVSDYVFRNWASDGKESKLFAEEILAAGYNKVGVIYEQTDYAEGLKISLEKYLEGTDVTIVSEGFTKESTDVRSQLSKLIEEDIEVLFISPQTTIAGDIVLKELSELGFEPELLIVNDNILKSKDLRSRYSDLLEGAIGGDFVIDETSEAAEFLERYETTYGVPCDAPNICVMVYDAVSMLGEATNQYGDNVESVKQYLETVEFDGLSGSVSFDSLNDRANAEYTLFEIQNGEAVLIN